MKETTTKTETLKPGCYSSGTLRAEDLFPIFVGLMRSVDSAKADKAQDEWDTTPSDWEQDDWRNEIVADLMNDLEEYVPAGHYFGTQEGDGACFGVWECENMENEPDEKQEAYEQMRADLESGDCYTINDKNEVFCNGKCCGKFSSMDDAFAGIRGEMDKGQYYCNIYSVNDHGNVTLHDSTGKEIASWV